MNIVIEESCDSFYIVLKDGDKEIKRYYFSQEETKEKLVDVFKKLGFKAKYEEQY
jgi:hypothetical protein